MGKTYFDSFLLSDLFTCFGSEKYTNWADKCVQHTHRHTIIANGLSVLSSHVAARKSAQDAQGTVIETTEKGVGPLSHFDL